MLALPIFPARLQASIFGRSELNFRVRNGNGWTLALINTNYFPSKKKVSKENFRKSFSLLTVFFNDKYYIRFSHFVKNFLSKVLFSYSKVSGDPYGNRTHVCGVRGRRLNRLTNGPDGAPSRIRTGDPLIKSQLLYQLS